MLYLEHLFDLKLLIQVFWGAHILHTGQRVILVIFGFISPVVVIIMH